MQVLVLVAKCMVPFWVRDHPGLKKEWWYTLVLCQTPGEWCCVRAAHVRAIVPTLSFQRGKGPDHLELFGWISDYHDDTTTVDLSQPRHWSSGNWSSNTTN